MQKYNPAANLNFILKQAAGLDDAKPAWVAWSSIFGCGPRDTVTIINGLKSVSSLLDETREYVLTYVPGDITEYTRALDQVGNFLENQDLSAQWSYAKKLLNQQLIMTMHFTVLALDQHFKGPSLNLEEEIAAFTSAIETLTEEILSSSLDDEVKKLLVKYLEKLRLTLIDYRLGGLSEIEETIKLMSGAMMSKKDILAPDSDVSMESPTRPFLKKVLELISDINTTVQTAQAAITTAAPVVLPLLNYVKQFTLP